MVPNEVSTRDGEKSSRLSQAPDSIWERDGWLAPAYFSPEYEYFDQQLQTVKNETIV